MAGQAGRSAQIAVDGGSVVDNVVGTTGAELLTRDRARVSASVSRTSIFQRELLQPDP